MKSQKRHSSKSAYLHGYKAGFTGHPQESCQRKRPAFREAWLSGWQEGQDDQKSGYRGVSNIHRNPNVLA